MPKPINITGQHFGRLTAIRLLAKGTGRGRLWLCKCKCGSVRQAHVYSLLCGDIRSCGCLRHGHAKHGKEHPLYSIWRTMHARCQNPTDQKYSYYGARGIRVCKRWKSFTKFIADMEPRPPGYILDRIKNNGHYTPSNIRWATHKQSANNKRPWGSCKHPPI